MATSGWLLDEPSEVPKHHSLLKLWQRVRPRLEKIWPSDKDFDAVEAVIEQFEALDPRSYAFRYPVDKAGGQALPAMHVNTRQLKKAVDGIANVLDGASTGISWYLEGKHQMLAEQRGLDTEWSEQIDLP